MTGLDERYGMTSPVALDVIPARMHQKWYINVLMMELSCDSGWMT